MEAIDGRTAHRLFMTICQFPAMRASWLREIVGGSSGEVSRHLKRFVDTGLVAVFDGRHYLSELGMRRAANMSRVLPAVIRSRHVAYLDRWYREHEQHHHDGVNRLVVRFAREGVEVVAVFVTNLNLTTYCYEPTAIACSWPNTKGQTSHLPIRRCNTKSLLDFCAISQSQAGCEEKVDIARLHPWMETTWCVPPWSQGSLPSLRSVVQGFSFPRATTP